MFTVADLDLSERSRNVLSRHNIDNVEKLISHTREQLLMMVNMGEKSVDEIEAKLWVYGLRLKQRETGALVFDYEGDHPLIRLADSLERFGNLYLVYLYAAFGVDHINSIIDAINKGEEE